MKQIFEIFFLHWQAKWQISFSVFIITKVNKKVEENNIEKILLIDCEEKKNTNGNPGH